MLDIKGGFNHNGGLPPYIVDGSLEAFEWRRDHPESEWEPRWAYEANEEEGTGSNGAHYAAHAGDLEVLTHIIENPQHRKDMIHEHDNNGWLPIHEVREMKLYKFWLAFHANLQNVDAGANVLSSLSPGCTSRPQRNC